MFSRTQEWILAGGFKCTVTLEGPDKHTVLTEVNRITQLLNHDYQIFKKHEPVGEKPKKPCGCGE